MRLLKLFSGTHAHSPTTIHARLVLLLPLGEANRAMARLRDVKKPKYISHHNTGRSSMREVSLALMLAIAMLGVGLMASDAVAGDSDLMLEMLNTMGNGMAAIGGQTDCMKQGKDAFLCQQDMTQKVMQEQMKTQKRMDERMKRKTEEFAVEACQQEQDPDAFARCVRSMMR